MANWEKHHPQPASSIQWCQVTTPVSVEADVSSESESPPANEHPEMKSVDMSLRARGERPTTSNTSSRIDAPVAQGSTGAESDMARVDDGQEESSPQVVSRSIEDLNVRPSFCLDYPLTLSSRMTRVYSRLLRVSFGRIIMPASLATQSG